MSGKKRKKHNDNLSENNEYQWVYMSYNGSDEREHINSSYLILTHSNSESINEYR